MDFRSLTAPFEEVFALLKQLPVLLAGLAMVATQIIGNYAVSLVSGPFPMGGHRMVPVVMMGTAAVKFAVFALVLFFLARRLGGPKGTAGKPNVLLWAGLMAGYYLLTKLTSFIPALVLRPYEMDGLRFAAVASTLSLLVRLVYFPVMVFIASAVFRSGGTRFSEVWSFLTSRGLAWYLCYAVFAGIFALAIVFLPMGLHQTARAPTATSLFSLAVLGIIGQLITLVFAVAAYRAVQRNRAPL